MLRKRLNGILECLANSLSYLAFRSRGTLLRKPASRPSTEALGSEPLVETLVLSINPVLQSMTPLRFASSGAAAAVMAILRLLGSKW